MAKTRKGIVAARRKRTPPWTKQTRSRRAKTAQNTAETAARVKKAAAVRKANAESRRKMNELSDMLMSEKFGVSSAKEILRNRRKHRSANVDDLADLMSRTSVKVASRRRKKGLGTRRRKKTKKKTVSPPPPFSLSKPTFVL